MSRVTAGTFLLALLAAGPACKSKPDPPGTVNVTLINMTDEIATGVVLEFDRRLQDVELESDEGFKNTRLGEPSPWSVTLSKGALHEGEAASFIVTGAEGAPEFVRGEWRFASGAEKPSVINARSRYRSLSDESTSEPARASASTLVSGSTAVDPVVPASTTWTSGTALNSLIRVQKSADASIAETVQFRPSTGFPSTAKCPAWTRLWQVLQRRTSL